MQDLELPAGLDFCHVLNVSVSVDLVSPEMGAMTTRVVIAIVKHRLKQNGNNTSTADLTLNFVVCAKKRNRAKGDVLISGPVIVSH